MKTILEVLNAVDEKFSSPDKWTKGAYACDANGKSCMESNVTAACYCLVGCVIAVDPDPKYENLLSDLGRLTIKYLEKIAMENFSYNPTHPLDSYIKRAFYLWNDAPERTFADVKNLLKVAKENLSNV